MRDEWAVPILGERRERSLLEGPLGRGRDHDEFARTPGLVDDELRVDPTFDAVARSSSGVLRRHTLDELEIAGRNRNSQVVLREPADLEAGAQRRVVAARRALQSRECSFGRAPVAYVERAFD